jgi:hypothetical protein
MNIKWLLGTVFVGFCTILLVCYIITKQAHPIFVDVDGHPTNATDKY